MRGTKRTPKGLNRTGARRERTARKKIYARTHARTYARAYPFARLESVSPPQRRHACTRVRGLILSLLGASSACNPGGKLMPEAHRGYNLTRESRINRITARESKIEEAIDSHEIIEREVLSRRARLSHLERYPKYKVKFLPLLRLRVADRALKIIRHRGARLPVIYLTPMRNQPVPRWKKVIALSC